MNKFLFVLIVFLLALAIFDQISFISTREYLSPAISSLRLAEIIGTIMMLYNGTFRNSKFYSFALFGFGLIFLSAAFKIMHLSGADELIVISFSAMAIFYSIHFFNKPEKTILDHLKLLLVFTFLSITPLTVLHIIDHDIQRTLHLVEHALFWTTFTLFIYQEGFRKKVLF